MSPTPKTPGFKAAARAKTKPLHVVVRPDPDNPIKGTLTSGGDVFPCVLGRSGAVRDKREGDGASPIGTWPVREVFYRPDRGPAPATALPVSALEEDDGWCDAPDDPNYNKPVTLPYDASHERMWRDDQLYDIVVVLGYNDDPVVPGKGSAIFLHIWRSPETPTAGCVAVSRENMLRILAEAGPGAVVEIA